MSKTQRTRIEILEKALNISWRQLRVVGCYQGCGGSGAIQISEDDCEQCQWCGEQIIIKNALGIKDKIETAPTQMANPDDLPF